MDDGIPAEVLRRAVREMLVLSKLEERRLREAGAGEAWEDACDAVDEWIDREGMLERLTDPDAASDCQSALKFDPLSACNIDPPEWHGGGCPGSQQGGPARLRVALCATRSEAAWGVPVGPPGQPGRGDGRRRTMNGS